MTAGTPIVGRSERLPALDLLRFIAAAMVVLFHYTFRGAIDGAYTTAAFPELDGLTRYGYLGVNLFFIISGFVILLTVDAGGGRPAHFVASRISRLFPAFWVAVTLTFVITVVADAAFQVSFRDYLSNLGMFPSWLGSPYVDGVYWTLETELYFYLLVTGYLLFLRRRVRIEWLLVAWLLVILPLVPNELGPTRFRALTMADTGPFFVAGCIFYRVWREGWTPSRIGILLLSWLYALVITTKGTSNVETNFEAAVSPLVASLVVTMAFAVFIGFTLRPSLFRIGGRRASLLGALTYPLYLIHQNVGYLVINAAEPIGGRWFALGVAIVTSLTIAYLIHRLVERPFNPRLRRWLEPRLLSLDRFAAIAHQWVPRRLRLRGEP
jgi:peptidoglycan/LPS O-acetylase OafA/YrhL